MASKTIHDTILEIAQETEHLHTLLSPQMNTVLAALEYDDPEVASQIQGNFAFFSFYAEQEQRIASLIQSAPQALAQEIHRLTVHHMLLGVMRDINQRWIDFGLEIARTAQFEAVTPPALLLQLVHEARKIFHGTLLALANNDRGRAMVLHKQRQFFESHNRDLWLVLMEQYEGNQLPYLITLRHRRYWWQLAREINHMVTASAPVADSLLFW